MQAYHMAITILKSSMIKPTPMLISAWDGAPAVTFSQQVSSLVPSALHLSGASYWHWGCATGRVDESISTWPFHGKYNEKFNKTPMQDNIIHTFSARQNVATVLSSTESCRLIASWGSVQSSPFKTPTGSWGLDISCWVASGSTLQPQ